GDCDYGVLSDALDLPPTLCRLRDWTRTQVAEPVPDAGSASRRLAFLEARPLSHQEDGAFFVHASPRDPLQEHLFPEDAHCRRKMDAIFAKFERLCFVGHSHMPGIFTADADFRSPEEFDYAYPLDGRQTLCNVGSVGQPRDGD